MKVSIHDPNIHRLAGMGVKYLPYGGKGYPLRGILQRVVVETNTAYIRFVYGKFPDRRIEMFDMPVAFDLVEGYGMWSSSQLQKLRSEIRELPPLPQASRLPTRLSNNDLIKKGDGLFLYLSHTHGEPNSRFLRLLPVTVGRVTKTLIDIGGIRFRRMSNGSHSIGSMADPFVLHWVEPSKRNPAFQRRIEYGLSAHTGWALDMYRETVGQKMWNVHVESVSHLSPQNII